MSVFMEICLQGRARIESKVHKFTGSDYYWMWPFAGPIRKRLEKWETDTLEKRVSSKEFIHVFEFLSREGLLFDQRWRSA
jgi:hypothetical protein